MLAMDRGSSSELNDSDYDRYNPDTSTDKSFNNCTMTSRNYNFGSDSDTSDEEIKPFALTGSRKRSINVYVDPDVHHGESSKFKKIKTDVITPDRKPLHEKNSTSENTEEESSDDDVMKNSEYEQGNLLTDLMSDINFDVNALLKRPSKPYEYGGLVTEKAKETYNRQRKLTTECIEKMYHDIQNAPKENIEKDPTGLKFKLMPHQRRSLQWMMWREKQKPSGGILADDMGLGKTLQMISLVLLSKNERKEKKTVAGNLVESDSDVDFLDLDLENCGRSRKIYDGRTLVVCPATLTTPWDREISHKVHKNKLKVYVYHGAKRTLNTDERKLSKYDIVITTYKTLAQEMELSIAPKKNLDSRLFRIHWERVILDEAHFIRNYNSKMSKAACALRAKSRWALTGTPIQNKQDDFYTLLKFIKCRPFDDRKIWIRWVNNKNAYGYQRLVVVSKTVMLRRTKEELMNQGAIQKLPDKQYEIIDVKMDPEERIVYEKMLQYSSTLFEEYLRQRLEKQLDYGGCTTSTRSLQLTTEIDSKILNMVQRLMTTHNDELTMYYILVLILRLRQMCCHPALVKKSLDKGEINLEQNGIEPKSLNASILSQIDDLMSDDDDVDENYAKNFLSKSCEVFRDRRKGSKVRAVLKVIDEILDKGEKVIVVSQWTGFLQVIANNLKTMPGANYEIFSGKVSLKNRQGIVDRLNDDNEELNVLLLSLTAGGVGLNLVGANNLLLIDLHWNPQWENQAQDRIYRFGQKHNIHIYKFICEDSIEEKIKRLQDKKLEIAHNLLSGTISNTLTIEDLKLLFSMEKDPAEKRKKTPRQETVEQNSD